MFEKKLIIINSAKDIFINQKNIFYINIGDGNTSILNSKKISLRDYRKTYYEKYKKKLLDELNKKILKAQNKIPFFIELEIFNLRNDKNTNIDLVINILMIKEIIKKYRFKEISLLTDSILTQEIFKKHYPKINLLNKNIKFTGNKFSFLKITKFYLKAFFVIALSKLYKNNKLIKSINQEACLSLKPIFYKKNEETFFKNKNIIKFNFLLTDESHLNFKFIDIIRIMKTKNENLIHIESFIKFKDLVRSLIKSYYYIFLTKNINLEFKVSNLNLSKFYCDYVTSSLINRMKLNIYNEGLIRALRKFDIKKFNLYLFEYSLGFFLINLIKKRLKKIRIIGHQHGIFSNNLMWFDLLVKNKNKNNYMPNEIISFNTQSFIDYKKKINSKNIKFNLKNKIPSRVSTAYTENKKNKYNILVLAGTHDAYTIYKNISNKILNPKNKNTYYLKFHPKKRILVSNSKYLKMISSIKNIKFSNVLISPTSTLVYDFVNLKKNFMVYIVDYKQNLISSSLTSKVKSYYF